MLLKFKVKDLEVLVEHARSSKTWKKSFGQKKVAPALWLVKDEGAYLMSNGLPYLKGEGENNLVVYAKGYRPENGHIGGDDWCEVISIEDRKSVV